MSSVDPLVEREAVSMKPMEAGTSHRSESVVPRDLRRNYDIYLNIIHSFVTWCRRVLEQAGLLILDRVL